MKNRSRDRASSLERHHEMWIKNSNWLLWMQNDRWRAGWCIKICEILSLLNNLSRTHSYCVHVYVFKTCEKVLKLNFVAHTHRSHRGWCIQDLRRCVIARWRFVHAQIASWLMYSRFAVQSHDALEWFKNCRFRKSTPLRTIMSSASQLRYLHYVQVMRCLCACVCVRVWLSPAFRCERWCRAPANTDTSQWPGTVWLLMRAFWSIYWGSHAKLCVERLAALLLALCSGLCSLRAFARVCVCVSLAIPYKVSRYTYVCVFVCVGVSLLFSPAHICILVLAGQPNRGCRWDVLLRVWLRLRSIWMSRTWSEGLLLAHLNVTELMRRTFAAWSRLCRITLQDIMPHAFMRAYACAVDLFVRFFCAKMWSMVQMLVHSTVGWWGWRVARGMLSLLALPSEGGLCLWLSLRVARGMFAERGLQHDGSDALLANVARVPLWGYLRRSHISASLMPPRRV